MAQVTVYLPDETLVAARQRAKQEERSLSAWVSDLIRRETASEWSKDFVDLLHHGGGDLVEPDDQPPEQVEPLR